MKHEGKDARLSKSEMKQVKGGNTYKYLCLHNGSAGYFFYNNENGQWRDLLGNVVSSNNLMNCGDCNPQIVAPQ